jgi:tetratricopeptide (TPR) repeat protein
MIDRIADGGAVPHDPSGDDLFDRVVHGLVTHASDTAERLRVVLGRDPGHVAATCLRGFAALGLAQNARLADARSAVASARASFAERGGSERDRALVEALSAWTEGAPREAAARLSVALEEDPTDLLLLKLEHGCRFMIGDSAGMRRGIDRALPAWTGARPGYGYVLGMASFGAVETGDLERGERLGREALEHAPDDAWGAHSVAHVHEMRDRAREGRAWLERCREAGTFAGCNNFGGHVAWHLALFCVAQGDLDRALALYDEEVIAPPPGDFRDVSNASSLLFRLEREGRDVGPRWDALLERVRPHLEDHGYAFADAHYALVLVRSGRIEEARALLASLRRHALGHTTHSARVQRTSGRALVEGIVALGQDDAKRAFEALAVAEDGAPAVGGSHAQRDLFRRLWVHAAERRGCAASLSRAVDAYLRARPDSPWAANRIPDNPEAAVERR